VYVLVNLFSSIVLGLIDFRICCILVLLLLMKCYVYF
jgi:hypothetical protein